MRCTSVVMTRNASWTGISDLKWERVLDELCPRTGIAIERHKHGAQVAQVVARLKPVQIARPEHTPVTPLGPAPPHAPLRILPQTQSG